ncbi:uncharacterized protein TRIADDRAFT_54508 [Trichoplax adhaerens]|uniref:Cation efflux protein transmembrane domain-containing protein n=1 Tax=Trichoplax adhaerens TaxID=10228 RepID=B3RS85_TRIAD|nr:hypothetical protein TRIADDRAFT_54508 [Trichoplax adhaerens]EDV26472.1 hypothetical protein TRIADDRAFT_54508 [Trichoplax adhaerens]|eukprot:XP_002110468.1 hypothetical protein TRIADDRAFT_54508 [Trichoplax adhaerens]
MKETNGKENEANNNDKQENVSSESHSYCIEQGTNAGHNYQTFLLQEMNDDHDERVELLREDRYSCVSHNDDGKHRLPANQARRWRRAALGVSAISAIGTVIVGIISIVLSTSLHSPAAFGFAFDAFLDAIAATVVIWRFYGKEGQSYSWNRERRACIVIAVLFHISALVILIRAILNVSHHNGKKIVKGEPLIILAIVSAVLCFVLAWLKFVISKRLRSRSLRTDAINSFLSGIMSITIVVSEIIQNTYKEVWYLDSIVAIFISLLLCYLGAKILYELLSQGNREPLEEEGDED